MSISRLDISDFLKDVFNIKVYQIFFRMSLTLTLSICTSGSVLTIYRYSSFSDRQITELRLLNLKRPSTAPSWLKTTKVCGSTAYELFLNISPIGIPLSIPIRHNPDERFTFFTKVRLFFENTAKMWRLLFISHKKVVTIGPLRTSCHYFIMDMINVYPTLLIQSILKDQTNFLSASLHAS